MIRIRIFSWPFFPHGQAHGLWLCDDDRWRVARITDELWRLVSFFFTRLRIFCRYSEKSFVMELNDIRWMTKPIVKLPTSCRSQPVRVEQFLAITLFWHAPSWIRQLVSTKVKKSGGWENSRTRPKIRTNLSSQCWTSLAESIILLLSFS